MIRVKGDWFIVHEPPKLKKYDMITADTSVFTSHFLGGAPSAAVIIVGNGHGKQSSDPIPDHLFFLQLKATSWVDWYL